MAKWGLFDHAQFALATPYTAGNASSSQSGSVILGGFYQFTDDRGIIPAMAFSTSVRPYYGSLHGTEINTQYLATKSLTGSRDGLSVHFNLSYRRLFDGAVDDRNYRVRFVAGVSLPVGDDLTLLTDVVRQDNRRIGEAHVRRRRFPAPGRQRHGVLYRARLRAGETGFPVAHPRRPATRLQALEPSVGPTNHGRSLPNRCRDRPLLPRRSLRCR